MIRGLDVNRKGNGKMIVVANATFQGKKWWAGPREARLAPYGAGYRWIVEERYVGEHRQCESGSRWFRAGLMRVGILRPSDGILAWSDAI
jgi:hypothetical protein